MKKSMVWLTAVAAAFSWNTLAEMMITSPTGTADENDVVLESAVNVIKEIPADTVAVLTDTFEFLEEEVRNTTHGLKSGFKGETPNKVVRDGLLQDVTDAWNPAAEILMRTYAVSAVVGAELAGSDHSDATTVDVRSFFLGIDFPEGTSAYYRPEGRRLVVFNTQARQRAVEEVLSSHHNAEYEYKQVEINAKFIEVSQSTLNQLGFTWRIEDVLDADGVKMFGDWLVNDNQDVLSAGIRTAAAAFGGGIPAAGSMVLTKGGWMPLSLTITAMEQAADSDVLSSPSLTTKDGQTAKMWVGEDRMVPQSFDVNSSEVNIHIQHSDWDSQLMGVYFSVTPEILKENIIRLELKPKIIDLLGYDTYQVSPAASMLMVQGSVYGQQHTGRYPITKYAKDGVTKSWESMQNTLESVFGFADSDPNRGTYGYENSYDYEWNDPDYTGENPSYKYSDYTLTSEYEGYPTPRYYSSWRKTNHEEFGTPLAPIYGSLPYFRVREIETTVDVADGSTVGLGGLIYDRLETYKDKVPVMGSLPLIGRLFRSEGERSIKRNLMIFVTATQVADNGQRKSDLVLNN